MGEHPHPWQQTVKQEKLFQLFLPNFCTARIGRADYEVANRAVAQFSKHAKNYVKVNERSGATTQLSPE